MIEIVLDANHDLTFLRVKRHLLSEDTPGHPGQLVLVYAPENRSPSVLYCLGTTPTHAAKSRPRSKVSSDPHTFTKNKLD